MAADGAPDAADLARKSSPAAPIAAQPTLQEAAPFYGADSGPPNHGIVDGNKRTARVVARLFPEGNRHSYVTDAIRIMEATAVGAVAESELAAWCRQRLTLGQGGRSGPGAVVKPRVVNETGEGAGGRQDTRASVSCAPRRAPARLVVAGFGMVGFKLVERLAALDALWRYDVTVVGEERHPAYDRVRLTEWLDHRDPDRLALARPGWAEALGIRVVTGMRVVSIDRERRLVRAAGGAQIGYDRLVLATGSAPFVPPIEGADHDGVFVYRTLDDLLRLRRRAGRVRRAVVLGGGWRRPTPCGGWVSTWSCWRRCPT